MHAVKKSARSEGHLESGQGVVMRRETAERSMRKLALPVRTARLNLREFVRGDFAAMHAYSAIRASPAICSSDRATRTARPNIWRPAGLAARSSRAPDSSSRWRKSPPGGPIGACDLSLIERDVVDLGYMLGRPTGARAIATEIALALLDAAFFDLRASASSPPSTSTIGASIRVLEKIGMRWEAVFRKHRRAKNRWWDCHLYVLPREVWEASPVGAPDRARALVVLVGLHPAPACAPAPA